MRFVLENERNFGTERRRSVPTPLRSSTRSLLAVMPHPVSTADQLGVFGGGSPRPIFSGLSSMKRACPPPSTYFLMAVDDGRRVGGLRSAGHQHGAILGDFDVAATAGGLADGQRLAGFGAAGLAESSVRAL